MQITFFSLFVSLTLFASKPSPTQDHGPGGPAEPQKDEQVKGALPHEIVLKLVQLICNPSDLLNYLKKEAIEVERHATEELDNSLRKVFAFDKSDWNESQRGKLVEAATQGTRRIQDKFKRRWTQVISLLRTDPNEKIKALGSALQPHVDAVDQEYERMIGAMPVSFTSVGCAACNVGYSPLSKSLKEKGLGRGAKVESAECASFDGHEARFDKKRYAVGIYVPGGKVSLTDKETKAVRNLEVPKELALLLAIQKFYDENKDKFTQQPKLVHDQIKALNEYVVSVTKAPPTDLLDKLVDELAAKTTQQEKFDHTLKRLQEFQSSPGLSFMKEQMSKLRADPSRNSERQRLMVSLGIPENGVVPSEVVTNRFSQGFTVNYFNFGGGPDSSTDQSNPILENVRSNLGGPTSEANEVLLELTGACFFCDAAQWGKLDYLKK